MNQFQINYFPKRLSLKTWIFPMTFKVTLKNRLKTMILFSMNYNFVSVSSEGFRLFSLRAQDIQINEKFSLSMTT